MSPHPPSQPDVEPQESPRTLETAQTKAPAARRSFAKLRRELSDDELGTPAVQRLLLDDIERLEGEARDAKEFREKFHEADKRAAILDEKFKGKISIEVVHAACITVGGVALGFSPSVWSTQPTGWIFVGLGLLMLVAGVVAKAVKP